MLVEELSELVGPKVELIRWQRAYLPAVESDSALVSFAVLLGEGL
ncbi:hypothetical protein [uncultured Enterovirga sp.]